MGRGARQRAPRAAPASFRARPSWLARPLATFLPGHWRDESASDKAEREHREHTPYGPSLEGLETAPRLRRRSPLSTVAGRADGLPSLLSHRALPPSPQQRAQEGVPAGAHRPHRAGGPYAGVTHQPPEISGEAVDDLPDRGAKAAPRRSSTAARCSARPRCWRSANPGRARPRRRPRPRPRPQPDGVLVAEFSGWCWCRARSADAGEGGGETVEEGPASVSRSGAGGGRDPRACMSLERGRGGAACG